ncbi:uncharacterized protein LOC128883916 [Hylaeus volcanicus]|uniref:uncharacterized protein LOC128883916 n=1 Tax=Hylaeus volcanicus TaxID=313075 RepID=UPI0023B86DC6|nr:uncharacterized protein LOC128883916 [Hylaeus volcanicus]
MPLRVTPPPLLFQNKLQFYLSHQSRHQTCHLCTLSTLTSEFPHECYEDEMTHEHTSQCCCVVSSSQIKSQTNVLKCKKPRVKTHPFIKLGINPLYYRTDYDKNSSYCIFTKNQVKRLLQYLNEAAERIYDQHIRLLVFKQLCPLKKKLSNSFTGEFTTSQQLREQVEWFVAITQSEVVSYRLKAWRLLQENNKLKVLLQKKNEGQQNKQQMLPESHAFPMIFDPSFEGADSPSGRNVLQTSKNKPLSFHENDYSLKKKKQFMKGKHCIKKKERSLLKKEEYLIKKEERLSIKEKCLLKKEDGLVSKEKGLLRKEDTLAKKQESLLKRENNTLERVEYYGHNEQSALKNDEHFTEKPNFFYQEHFLSDKDGPVNSTRPLSSKKNDISLHKTNALCQNKSLILKPNVIVKQTTLELGYQHASHHNHDVSLENPDIPLNTKDRPSTTEIQPLQNDGFLFGTKRTQPETLKWPTNTEHSLSKNYDPPGNTRNNLSTIYESRKKKEYSLSKSINGPRDKSNSALKQDISTLKKKKSLPNTQLDHFKKNDLLLKNDVTKAKNTHSFTNIQHSQLQKHDLLTSTDSPLSQIQNRLSSYDNFDLINKNDMHPVFNKSKTKFLNKKLGFLTHASALPAKNSDHPVEDVATKFHTLTTDSVPYMGYRTRFEQNNNVVGYPSPTNHDVSSTISFDQIDEKVVSQNVHKRNSVKICDNQHLSLSKLPSSHRYFINEDNTPTEVKKPFSNIYPKDFHPVFNNLSSDTHSNETSLMPLPVYKMDVDQNPAPKQFRYDINDFLSPYPINMDTEDETSDSHIKSPLKEIEDCPIIKTFKTQISKVADMTQTVNTLDTIATDFKKTQSIYLYEIENTLNHHCVKFNQDPKTLVASRRSENNTCRSVNSTFSLYDNPIKKQKHFTLNTRPLYLSTSRNLFNEEPSKNTGKLIFSPKTDVMRRFTYSNERSCRKNKPVDECSTNGESKSHILVENIENQLSNSFNKNSVLSEDLSNMMQPSLDDNVNEQAFYSNSKSVINSYAHKQHVTSVTTCKPFVFPFISNGVESELIRQKILKQQAHELLRSNIIFQSDFTFQRNSCNQKNKIKSFLKQQLYKIKQELFNSETLQKKKF